jgi:hypothetical protein
MAPYYINRNKFGAVDNSTGKKRDQAGLGAIDGNLLLHHQQPENNTSGAFIGELKETVKVGRGMFVQIVVPG